MANRAIDLLITYRVIKLLVTPFDKQEAFTMGIIDKDGNILKKNKDLRTEKEKNSYTYLHRFIFNLKRILAKVGISGSIASFGVALALLLKENEEMIKHKSLIESTIITYLKETNQYDRLLNDVRVIKESKEEPFMNCFGIDIYERNGELVSEYENV
jgi:hypothetical protein